MRKFLVSTTALSVVTAGGMSNAIKDVMAQGRELAMAFIDALVELQGDSPGDGRKWSDCA
jgi:hypothetical protein